MSVGATEEEVQAVFNKHFKEFLLSESANPTAPRITPGMSPSAICAVLNTPYSLEEKFAKFLLQPVTQISYSEFIETKQMKKSTPPAVAVRRAGDGVDKTQWAGYKLTKPKYAT